MPGVDTEFDSGVVEEAIKVGLVFDNRSDVLMESGLQAVLSCDGVDDLKVSEERRPLLGIKDTALLVSEVVPHWSEDEHVGAGALELLSGPAEVFQTLVEHGLKCHGHGNPASDDREVVLLEIGVELVGVGGQIPVGTEFSCPQP